MAIDDMRPAILELLRTYQERCGTNMRGAVRDLVAEVATLCTEEGIDPDEILQQGLELFAEEEEMKE